MAPMSSEPVFVHVGLPKTGTTQLQRILWDNRKNLADKGIVYPGPERAAHYHGALDLLGSKRSRHPGSWASLVERARRAEGRVIISHEMLAALSDDGVASVVADLAPREVHVLVSIRDFSRIVSATWQERAKNREVEPWPEFLERVAQGPDGGHAFWRLQDAPRIIRQWADHVPSDRIHVLTIPPLSQDPDLLLRRFAGLVGFSADDVRVPEQPANQSLGAVEIALLQRINALTGDLDWETYRRSIKNFVVKEFLAPRKDQVRVVLPESARSWVLEETQRISDCVESVGCQVIGDLAELEPTGIGAGGGRTTDAPHEVTDADVADAATRLSVDLVRRRGEGGKGRARSQPTSAAEEEDAKLTARARRGLARLERAVRARRARR